MPEHGSIPAVEVEEVVSQIIRARRGRAVLFTPGLFSDPAWDMLLSLFLARTREEATSETELAAEAGTSIPTAARWIDALERDGLLRRTPRDKQRPLCGKGEAPHRASKEQIAIVLAQAFPLPKSGKFRDLLEAINSSEPSVGR